MSNDGWGGGWDGNTEEDDDDDSERLGISVPTTLVMLGGNMRAQCAVTITDAEELAGAMTEKLAELFDEDLAWRQLHRAVPSAARARRRHLH